MRFASTTIAVGLLFAVVAGQTPVPAPADEARAAWRYRRAVVMPAGAEGVFVAVPLPPDAAARSQARLEDVRLVDATGRETPYVVVEDQPRAEERRLTGMLVEARQERRLGSTWTVDLGAPVLFDRLELEMPDREFATRFAVEVSADGMTWLVVDDRFWAFDRIWQGRPVHDTALDLPPTTARFVRFSADDNRSRPPQVRGATAVLRRQSAGSSWTRAAELAPLGSTNGRSRYAVAVPPGFPVRHLEIDADDPAFARPVSVLAQDGGQDRPLGQATIYRLRLPDTATDVESRGIEVARATSGGLVVEVQDGDTPPLVNPRATLAGPQTLLLTATTAPPLTLYYGNPVTRRAVYDLERLRPHLALVAGFPTASVAAEAENPRFRAPTPLGFMPARGAVVDSTGWRFVRRVLVQGADDLYSLTLDPADAGRGRADLSDLRLVDGGDRQVPFVVERDVETVSLPLATSPASPFQGRGRRSALQLRMPAGALPAPVALTAIEIRVAESYFRRAATVSMPAPDAPLGRRVVGSTTIAAADRSAATGAIVRIPLGSVTAPELLLEIEDGDNAPLTVVSVAGLASVPRLTFKAAAGEYRLLLGNDDVQAPAYELDGLRQEVLDYTAVPIPPAWLDVTVANPGGRRITAVLREPPATAVLWAALGTAVVVLLVLTRRILRAEPPGPRS